MSLLDSLFGIQRVFGNGVEAISRKAIDFVGDVEISDDSVNGRTRVLIEVPPSLVWVPAEEDVLEYPELKIWYDGDHVTLASGAISQLLDRGPLANHSAVQSTSTKRPAVSSLNGRGSISFDGGDCIQTPSIAVSTFSIFTVLHEVIGNGIIYEQSANAGTNPGCYAYTTENNAFTTRRGSTTSGYNIAAKPNGPAADWALNQEPMVLVHHYLGTHIQHTLWLRGNSQTTNASVAAANPGTGTATDIFNLGSRANAGSLGMTGKKAAWLLFSPALSGFHRDAVCRMLSFKYKVGAA